MESEKYIALMMIEGKFVDLFPLTHNSSASLLSVSNKKLILYQLEQLEKINKIAQITILYNSYNSSIKDYIEGDFLPKNKNYPHTIAFFLVDDNKPQYESFSHYLNSPDRKALGQVKGLILIPVDLISSVPYAEVLKVHEAKKSDVTLFLKQKKEYGEKEKKSEEEFEPSIDMSLMSGENQVFCLESMESCEGNKLKIHPSLYSRVSRGTFYRVFDTTLYIFSDKTLRIAQNLKIPDPISLKNDFISILVRNQCNANLVDFAQKPKKEPLKIFAKLARPDTYLRRILDVKIFEKVNLEALITGQKQKDTLQPTKFTTPYDEKAMETYKGCIIGASLQIQGQGIRLTRSVIGNGCKIGKNVEILNSVISENVTIEDGCKIVECVVGANSLIMTASSLSSCQLASCCVIKNGSIRSNQVIIPL